MTRTGLVQLMACNGTSEEEVLPAGVATAPEVAEAEGETSKTCHSSGVGPGMLEAGKAMLIVTTTV